MAKVALCSPDNPLYDRSSYSHFSCVWGGREAGGPLSDSTHSSGVVQP